MLSPIIVSQLSFDLPDGRKLFQNLNFTLDTRITALVGPNGIGKTTLAKLVQGEVLPTAGLVKKSSSVEMLAQRETAPAITVGEFLAPYYEWSLLGDRLLEGIEHETLCSNLSGGQWMRVRLARVAKDRFLILDEPTNDLDREGREYLFDFLKNFENGVLLISHDRECLSYSEVILELSNQGLSKFTGHWNDYESSKAEERERTSFLLESAKRNRDHALEDRRERIARQEKRNRQGAESAARGGMPKILLGARKRKAQATSGKIDAATFEKAQSAVNDAYARLTQMKADPVMYADLIGTKIPHQKLIAEASQFNIRFSGWLYESDLNFSWRGNLRLAISGRNGSGKSTLLKSILGNSYETKGTLRTGQLKTLYIDQKCQTLDDTKSIFENIRDVCQLHESEIRNALAKFLFAKDVVFQSVGTLSGGERLRAALAKGLISSEKPELLILDEPTNNLDLLNIEFLENLVRQFQGPVIIVSHDKSFLKNSGISESFEV